MKWILRGVLVSMGAIFVLSLTVVAAMLFLLSLIRWLFTGRKPSILMAVTTYQQLKHGTCGVTLGPAWQKCTEYRR